MLQPNKTRKHNDLTSLITAKTDLEIKLIQRDKSDILFKYSEKLTKKLLSKI